MKRTLTSALLFVAGLSLSAIGSALLVAPREFLATSQVMVANDPGLMSELAAPSITLIAAGGLMLVGGFKPRFAKAALSLGAFIYGSYGIGRLAAIALHGMPSSSLVTAMIVEFVIAGLLIAARVTAPRGDRAVGVPLAA